MEDELPVKAPRRRLHDVAHALAAAVLASMLAFAILGLREADLTVPMGFSGDGLLHLTMIKAIIEEGWPLTIERLGAPGELDFRDFPALDNLNLFLARGLALFIRSPGLLLNVLFLLTFPLVAASAFLVSRRLGLSPPASWCVAVLYALLPYHFRRGVGHLFMSAYYLVPPAILLACELARGTTIDAASPRTRRNLICAVLLCIALGSTTVYYGFFAAIFLLAGGVLGMVGGGPAVRPSVRPLLTALLLIGIILAAIVVNHLPTILKESREGSLNVATRWPAEAELYGLKIAQLVLPITEHRFTPFEALKRRYNAAPLVSENDTASLGLVGTAGFLFLGLWLFFFRAAARERLPHESLLDHLSVLNAAGVLFGTIGGFASLFSLLVSPQIRSVNRISVFIAFFSLVAAGVLFDRITRAWRPLAVSAAALLVILAGAADQTSSNFRHSQSEEPGHLAPYMATLEGGLPRDAALFQLPYFPFPEHGRVHELHDYSHLRPYIYSSDLRFSYGAVRGSREDLWQRHVAALPPEEMARSLALAGFEAIWIERAGFEDRGLNLERTLRRTAGSIPFQSTDGMRSVIRLDELRRRLRAETGQSFEDASEEAKHPLLIGWRGGFYGEETVGEEKWHWSQREGEMLFYGHSRKARTITVRMKIASAHFRPSTIRIQSSFWNETLTVTGEPVAVERMLTVPPGTHRVTFRFDGGERAAPNDPRRFAFRVVDFSVEPASRGQEKKRADETSAPQAASWMPAD